jgi:Domain of unknown function (DUF4126)
VDNIVQTVAVAAGLGWASGMRLYAVLFFVGLLGKFGYIALPEHLSVLTHPWVLGASGFMFAVEFLADKIPAVDSVWDALHTFIRIPAGAILAAAALGDVSTPLMLAAGILGGTLASGSHFTKAGSRAVINTSPEPFSNWAASFSEDALTAGGLWTAFQYPIVFLIALVLFIAIALWLLPKIWRRARGVIRFFSRAASSCVRGPKPDSSI